MMNQGFVLPSITRRRALREMGGGFGMVGLASLLGQGLYADTQGSAAAPMAVKPPHFPARAKHLIFLFLNGGLSQVDSLDPKPMLGKYDGQPFPGGNPRSERKTGNLMKSPFRSRRYGQSGLEMTDIFPRLGECAD